MRKNTNASTGLLIFLLDLLEDRLDAAAYFGLHLVCGIAPFALFVLAGSLRGVSESSGDSDHTSKLQFFLLQLCCPLHMLSLPPSLALVTTTTTKAEVLLVAERAWEESSSDQRRLYLERNKALSLSLTDRRPRSIDQRSVDDRLAHRPL